VAATVFRFKFQKILDVKEKQQQAAEIELAGVDKLLSEANAVLELWRRARRTTMDEQRSARHEGRLGLATLHGHYLDYVRARLDQCHGEVAKLRDEREQVRGELLRLMRARKVLEKYRDRLKKEFYRQMERDEEKEQGEHSIYKFIQSEGAL